MNAAVGPEEVWVRYVKTSALTRALSPIEAGAVMDLTATRSIQTEASEDSGLPYVRLVNRSIRSLRIDFNRVRDGAYDKDGVQRFLESTLEEAVIQNLDLLFPGGFSKLVGDTRKDDPASEAELASHQYVGHFSHYPCNRDGERNAFWEDVDLFMTPEERTWMERASLDFEYFVPVEVFRDVSLRRGHVSAGFAEQIKRWQDVVGTNPPLLRAGMEMLFPDPDMINRRVYRWEARQKRILDRVGET